MGLKRAYRHNFQFYYQWVPTSSAATPYWIPNNWPNDTINHQNVLHGIPVGSNFRGLTNGLYMNGFPGLVDTNATETQTPAISVDDYQPFNSWPTTPNESAIPKGSMAADYLWNVRSLSSSLYESSSAGRDFSTTYFKQYHFSYSTASFAYHNIGVNPGNKFVYQSGFESGWGLPSHSAVDSYWVTYEPKMYECNFSWSLYSNTGLGGSSNGPWAMNYAIPGTAPEPYAKPSARSEFIPNYSEGNYEASANSGVQTPLPVGTNPPGVTYDNDSTGSNDGRFFTHAGGCGITRADIEAALTTWELSKNLTDTPGRQAASSALLKRRLFFPNLNVTASNQILNLDQNIEPNGSEWLSLNNGFQGNTQLDIFDENGGIYNIKFNLKRDIANDFYPDTGKGSELLVFIFQVNTTINQSGAASVPGKDGFYPPDNNIVKITNNPEMSFLNPATGYLIESFNISVVQYGFPAQLCFEACQINDRGGALDNGNYFGCIIDGVEFCKIGVSTDPNLIKPAGPAEVVPPPSFPSSK